MPSANLRSARLTRSGPAESVDSSMISRIECIYLNLTGSRARVSFRRRYPPARPPRAAGAPALDDELPLSAREWLRCRIALCNEKLSTVRDAVAGKISCILLPQTNVDRNGSFDLVSFPDERRVQRPAKVARC